MLTTAVIGLGQAGSRFDEEPRPMVWSHTGAYLGASDRFHIAGGADINEDNLARFKIRCPKADAFSDVATMVSAIKPDVISICTPPKGRAKLVETILSLHRPKILVCEKPLELDELSRQKIVEICADASVPLLVNYNRRFATIYRMAHKAIEDGILGEILSITVIASNRLWSIGSHTINLLYFLAGDFPETWMALPRPDLYEDSEPAVDFSCRFPSGAAGHVLTIGAKGPGFFEVDIFGKDARLQITKRGTEATISRFKTSQQYLNYRVLSDPEEYYCSDPNESTFQIMVNEAADIAEGKQDFLSSSGNDALRSETMLDKLAGECNK
jgi:predicted dehydrogenase